MNSLAGHKINKPVWLIEDNRVVLKLDEKRVYPTGPEIVRIEFKNNKSINNISIETKVSDTIDFIHFNRFPLNINLCLLINENLLTRPVCLLEINNDNKTSILKYLPISDQYIIDNEWFPLINEQLDEVRKLLKEADIHTLGRVTLKQCLILVKSSIDLLRVISDQNTVKNYIESIGDINTHDELIYDQPNLNATLYPYQEKGVEWLNQIASEEIGCILADEMGLGKTIQVIALLLNFIKKWNLPSLIISPSTLLENWNRELKRFAPSLDVMIHSGTTRTGFPSKIKKHQIVITSYDLAVRDQSLFNMVEWSFIVLDEAQNIKNPETKRASVIKTFNRKVSIAVTGTPVENRLLDLWSIMDFAYSGYLGDLKTFEQIFNDSLDSAIKLEQLVTPLILRRKVIDVAKDLPEKIIIPQPIPMSEDSLMEYEDLRQSIEIKYGKGAGIVAIVRLRQFCTHPLLINETRTVMDPAIISTKYARLIEILEEIIINNEKAIIFTSYIKMIDLMTKDLKDRFNIYCLNIDGRTPIQERQKIVDNFSSYNGVAVLILNPKAAGTGLNITAANHVIHYNLEWNPAIEDQATARAYRRGQNLPVFVHRLFHPFTVEEIMNDRIERKRLLSESAIIGIEGIDNDIIDIAKAIAISPLHNKNEL